MRLGVRLGLMLVAGVRAMKEGDARGFVVEGEKDEWLDTLAVQVTGEVRTGLVVVKVGGAMISDLCIDGEESLEGEEDIVEFVFEETVEVGSLLLEWCFEK